MYTVFTWTNEQHVGCKHLSYLPTYICLSSLLREGSTASVAQRKTGKLPKQESTGYGNHRIQ